MSMCTRLILEAVVTENKINGNNLNAYQQYRKFKWNNIL